MLKQHQEDVVHYFDLFEMMNEGDDEDLEMMQLILQVEPILMQVGMETASTLFCEASLKQLMRQPPLDGCY